MQLSKRKDKLLNKAIGVLERVLLVNPEAPSIRVFPSHYNAEVKLHCSSKASDEVVTQSLVAIAECLSADCELWGMVIRCGTKPLNTLHLFLSLGDNSKLNEETLLAKLVQTMRRDTRCSLSPRGCKLTWHSPPTSMGNISIPGLNLAMFVMDGRYAGLISDNR